MQIEPLTEKERIEALAFRLGISIRRLAKIVGMSENTFYHISDKSRFGISERTASKICYNLEKKMQIMVNRDWLLTGEGEMIDERHSILPYHTDEKCGAVLLAAESNEKSESQNYCEKYIKLLEEYHDLQRKYTALLERLS